MSWTCDSNNVVNTQKFWQLLNSDCTVSRHYLFSTLHYLRDCPGVGKNLVVDTIFSVDSDWQNRYSLPLKILLRN